MKQAKLRDWLEIVGIFAVVVSLVFVGLQMRQTQEIAMAEMRWNNMIAEMEAHSAIYEFPDIWAKGNAGETLNPSETVIYATLMRNFNALQFYAVTNYGQLSGDESDLSATISNTSGFLFENPFARREWGLYALLSEGTEPHMYPVNTEIVLRKRFVRN